MRFVFTNEGDSAIRVLPPSWIISKEDVSVQHPFTFRYQLEKSKGISGGEYKPEYWGSQELDELQVGPGWSFTFYVGLDPTMKPLDLEKKRGDHRLGAIRIPVNVGDYVVDFEERV